MGLRAYAPLIALLLLGCEGDPWTLSGEEILDPEACKSCHPEHYRQWSGSMHAYTGVDPLFDAMNRVFQEDTAGEHPDYCVGCHSPMALSEGATTDGLDLQDAPAHLKGVTCAACHLIDESPIDHNAGQTRAEDGVMRGGIARPGDNPAHDSAYSLMHDRNDPSSSFMCGPCHCVFTPDGTHVERTFREWRDSVFASNDLTRATCGSCHMRGRDGKASTDLTLPTRRLHDHSWPGVDTALTSFPNKEEQAQMIQEELDNSLLAWLCLQPEAGVVSIIVRLETVGSGHSFPSGTTVDRRVWVEVHAYVGDTEVFSSGVVGDDEAVTANGDPTTWIIRDRHLDAAGDPVLFPWQAAEVTGNLLEAATSIDPSDPGYYHSQERHWPVVAAVPDRVTAKVRMRAMGMEVFEGLETRGGLDPALKSEQPTWDLSSTELEWTGGIEDLGTCVN